MHIIEVGLGVVFSMIPMLVCEAPESLGIRKVESRKSKPYLIYTTAQSEKWTHWGQKCIQDLVSLEEHFTVLNKCLWKRDVPCSQYLKR